MTTSNDERTRLRHYVRNLRAALDALDAVMDEESIPIGGDTAQNIASMAVQISNTISRADAYLLAARKARVGVVCKTCNDTHRMSFGEDRGEVPCTHCPSPCEKCRGGRGKSAYCEHTPCACECHERRGR